MTAARAFHALHHGDEPLLLPNAWDYGSAAALIAAGFPAIGTTSLGVAVANGLPDGQGATRAETVALAHRLARLSCLYSVDIEGGFGGDPAGVAELVAELADAGAVGVNLEDGRPDGALAATSAQCARIAAIKARVPDLFVNARTDTHWLTAARPPVLADTIDRVRAYQAAGADGVFVPGLADPAEIGALARAVDAPLNVLFLPAGPTVRQLAELGVRRISTGSLLFRAAVHAAVATVRAIAAGRPVAPDIPSYAEMAELGRR